jgi:hypothetical protein
LRRVRSSLDRRRAPGQVACTRGGKEELRVIIEVSKKWRIVSEEHCWAVEERRKPNTAHPDGWRAIEWCRWLPKGAGIWLNPRTSARFRRRSGERFRDRRASDGLMLRRSPVRLPCGRRDAPPGRTKAQGIAVPRTLSRGRWGINDNDCLNRMPQIDPTVQCLRAVGTGAIRLPAVQLPALPEAGADLRPVRSGTDLLPGRLRPDRAA